jgi:hypothetical protein
VDTAKSKGKSKDGAKAKDRVKDKGKAKEEPPVYDYHDGSVHDSALCAHLKRGYEMFKVWPWAEEANYGTDRHGSVAHAWIFNLHSVHSWSRSPGTSAREILYRLGLEVGF